MFVCTALVMPLAVATPPTNDANTPSQLTVEQISAILTDSNQLMMRDFDTAFELRIFPSRPVQDDRPWEPESWDMLEDFRLVASGNRFYSLRRAYAHPTSTNGTPPLRYSQGNVWSDGTWSHRVHGEEVVTLQSIPVPTDFYSQEFVFDLIDGRFPSFASLADQVKVGRPIKQSVKDGILTYRFASADVSAASLQHILEIRLATPNQLLSHTIELSDAAEDAIEDFDRHVYQRQTYRVVDWMETGVSPIPRVVQLDATGPENARNRQSPQAVRRAVYTRQSIRFLAPGEADEQLFTVAMPSGTKVHDERINLDFEIGKSLLILDGQIYETGHPIEKHPGDQLGEMVRQSTKTHRKVLHSPTSPSANSGRPSPADSSPKPGKHVVVSAILGVGAALLVGTLLRYWSLRKPSP